MATQDKSSFIPFAAISGFACFVAVSSHAAVLGDAQLRSGIGDRLVLAIPIIAKEDEQLSAECFAVEASVGDDNPYSGHGLYKSFVQKGANGVLTLESTVRFEEPIVKLNIALNCPSGSSQRRSYTLLLDLPVNARGDEVWRSSKSGEPAATSSRSSRQPSPAPEKLPVAGEANGEVLETTGKESLNQIARRLYPEDRAARDNFRAILRDRYGDDLKNGNKRLPAGMKLIVPPSKPEIAATTIAPVIVKSLPQPKQAPVKAASKPSEPAEKPTLSISPPQKPSAASPTQASSKETSKVADTRDKKGKDDTREKLAELERTLLDRMSEQISDQHRLQDRLEKLESYSAQLQAKLKAREQEILDERKAREAAVAYAKEWHLRDWLALGALGLAIAALGLALFKVGRRNAQTSNGFGDDVVLKFPAVEAALSRELDDDLAAEFARTQPIEPLISPAPPPPRPVATSKRASLMDTQEIQPSSLRPWTEEVIENEMELEFEPVSEHKDAASDVEVIHLANRIDEAMLLAEHGMVPQAIEILQDELAQRPQFVNAWLSLLKVFHANGRQSEFIPLARTFRERFLSRSMWEQVSAMGRDLAPNDPLFAEEKPPETPVAATPLVFEEPASVQQFRHEPPASALPELVFAPANSAPSAKNEPLAPSGIPTPVVPSIELSAVQAPPAKPKPIGKDEDLSFAVNFGHDDEEVPAANFGKQAASDIHLPDKVNPRLADTYPRLGVVAAHLAQQERGEAVDLLQQCLIEGDWEEKTEALRLLGSLKMHG